MSLSPDQTLYTDFKVIISLWISIFNLVLAVTLIFRVYCNKKKHVIIKPVVITALILYFGLFIAFLCRSITISLYGNAPPQNSSTFHILLYVVYWTFFYLALISVYTTWSFQLYTSFKGSVYEISKVYLYINIAVLIYTIIAAPVIPILYVMQYTIIGVVVQLCVLSVLSIAGIHIIYLMNIKLFRLMVMERKMHHRRSEFEHGTKSGSSANNAASSPKTPTPNLKLKNAKSMSKSISTSGGNKSRRTASDDIMDESRNQLLTTMTRIVVLVLVLIIGYIINACITALHAIYNTYITGIIWLFGYALSFSVLSTVQFLSMSVNKKCYLKICIGFDVKCRGCCQYCAEKSIAKFSDAEITNNEIQL